MNTAAIHLIATALDFWADGSAEALADPALALRAQELAIATRAVADNHHDDDHDNDRVTCENCEGSTIIHTPDAQPCPTCQPQQHLTLAVQAALKFPTGTHVTFRGVPGVWTVVGHDNNWVDLMCRSVGGDGTDGPYDGVHSKIVRPLDALNLLTVTPR